MTAAAWLCRAVLAGVVLAGAGCASRPPLQVDAGALARGVDLSAQVPFHPQTRYQCGPAALAGVLGALLAGRADDVRAEPALAARLAAAAALVHGLAATRANPGGPVAAGAVARAVPATVSRLLTVPTGGRVPRSRR